MARAQRLFCRPESRVQQVFSRASFKLVAVVLCAAAAVTLPLAAKVFSTTEQALGEAFPGCTVERQTVFLTEAQLGRAAELAGEPIESALVHPYRATCGGSHAGTAYFDTHRVRTLPETLMIVVAPDGSVEAIEILTFDEPTEYIPPDIWYEQFLERRLGPGLELKRGIDAVTGATLTAVATTDAVRRVLAVDRVLDERPAEDDG